MLQRQQSSDKFRLQKRLLLYDKGLAKNDTLPLRYFHCCNFKMTFDEYFIKLQFFNFFQITTMSQYITFC